MNFKTQNIYLIGPMGAGKTTIGRLLSQALNMKFMDTDHEIQRRTGADIPWIFELEGEKGFRKREKKMIADLCEEKSIVLATGGGAIMLLENRLKLSATGLVIYLDVPISIQLHRTLKNNKRPMLYKIADGQQTDTSREEKEDKLLELQAIRRPLYESIADITINTNRASTKITLSQILADLKMQAQ